MTLSIQDDGRGFDVNTRGKGLGIVGMYERIEALDGHFEMESQVDTGMTVRARVPAPTRA